MQHPPFERDRSAESWRACWHLLLACLCIVSVAGYLLSLAGQFLKLPLLLLVSTIVFFTFLKKYRLMPDWRKMVLLVCGFASLSLLFYVVSPPYQAALQAEDASLYMAAAFHLSQKGSIEHQDPLVKEMTPQERRLFFTNRFPGDRTGTWARFPGGVRLLEPESPTVTFSFYHLFPVLLAEGVQLFGPKTCIDVLPLLLAFSTAALFLILRPWIGFAGAAITCAGFYGFFPQQYFARLPFAEIATQAFFLTGLSVLAPALCSQSIPDSPTQRLAGLLWGCLFLTRIDGMILLILSLLFVFSWIPFFRTAAGAWLPLLRILMLFALLAFFHQAVSGEYEYLFTSGTYFKGNAIVYVLIDAASRLYSFAQHFTAWTMALWIALSLLILLAPLRITGASRWMPWVSIVFVIASLLLWILGGTPVANLQNTLSWISAYIPLPVLLAQLGCVVVLLLTKTRERNFVLLCAVILATFSFPYLFRPMINSEQPLCMRRFVPFVFPLWFLLSSSGGSFLLRRFIRSRSAADASFSIIAASFAIYFFTQSTLLFTNPLYKNTLNSVENVSSQLPDRALVLVPDSIAGLHMQLPLQYLFSRDSLVLPLKATSSPEFKAALDSYLNREVRGGRKIFVISIDGDPGIAISEKFQAKTLRTTTVSFASIETTEGNRKPQQIKTTNFAISLSQLSPKTP